MDILPTKDHAEAVKPEVVYGPGVDPALEVDTYEVAQTMARLGTLTQTIGSTTLYIGGKNNYVTKGFQIPKSADRMLHGVQPRNEGPGTVIRVNTMYRGQPRGTDDMNKTLVHELEHIAQADRKDIRYFTGLIGVYGLALAGGLAGARFVKGSFAKKVVAATLGAALGHQAAYVIAPHERQAKQRAEDVATTAIRRND